MTKPLLLALLVMAVVGCGTTQAQDSEVRAYIEWLKAERELTNPLGGSVDTLVLSFTMYHHKQNDRVPYSSAMLFIDWLMDDAERMQARISRLAADSAKCAERVRNENTFYRCAEPWWVIAPCGDTLYGHGCTLDSMGAGMNPDSSYHATLRELQRCLMQCTTRKGLEW